MGAVRRDDVEAMGHPADMRKLAIFTGVLLLIAALAAALVLWLGAAPTRTATLANGLSVEYLGTTYGTNHVTPGYSRLARLLPRPMQSLLGLTRARQSFTTPTPALVVWLSEDPLSSTNGAGAVSMVSLLADEDGVVAGNDTWYSILRGPSGAPTPFTLVFRAAPANGGELSVRFFDPGGGTANRTLLGELAIPNPALRNSPGSSPEPLPAIRTNGTVTCRLDKLAVGVGFHTRQRTTPEGLMLELAPVDPGFAPAAVGLFRFETEDQTGTNWTVGAVLLADAAGNPLQCGSRMNWYGDGRVIHRFGPTLWPDEAWNLTVWARRKPTARFAAEELIVLDGIAVPGLGETNQLDRVFQRHGREVRVEHFAHRPPPPKGGYLMTDLTHLRVVLSELPEGVYFELVGIADEQGRELVPSGWSSGHGTPSEATFAFREVPKDARKLTARMVLQQGRRFEFRVQPEVVGSNGFQIAIDR